MNPKKIFRVAAISLAAIVAVLIAGIVIWSKTGTYTAGGVALSGLDSTATASITQDRWIVFAPAMETETGIIFYPGGLVEPSAYAPVLHAIAEEGVLVVITPMPLNLAIFNTSAANAVIDAYPEVSTWVIAGHSLGGAAAAIYAENHPEAVAAIALWDSYPPGSADLSDNSIAALSIYGTTNGVPNTDNFDRNRPLLPADTQFIAIEGASHAQFGDYGPQKGDVVPSISLAEQHQRVTEIMLEFMNP
ncbi:MAG: alpha/beta hydrolase [Anaerolineales bacterium]|nr:alpha/beta hydrolase [Anaerolineales bacterium]